MSKKIKRNPRSMGRKWALQYLYQSDIAKLEFNEDEFELFIAQILDAPSAPNQHEAKNGFAFAREIIEGVLNNILEIDKSISDEAKNWKIDRMATTDRNVLRIAVFELMEVKSNHPIVIVNEAVELAKTFGDTDSFKFVNGMGDTLARKFRPKEMEK
ncbi:transcription antitermination factor NusB [Lentisphaera profundi]|uniref:Transcription antitermination protein NusB n=1 Tax=Lentisphaera profundi TaxID=1658616 RepID=A0ABY7VNZ6_9BACT|nr:transcription antitermination factor NusB [Lentisphaera profundi]WDE95871.1 transcription antitermination factor NusB [Lentisphaera profundi]